MLTLQPLLKHLTEFSLAEALQLLQPRENLSKAQPSSVVTGFTGRVAYYHYACDGFNDAGWGCGYRACQTVLHWLLLDGAQEANVPSLSEIQSALVAMGDKPDEFAGSKDWIGCLEAAYIIDRFANRRCRILHQRSPSEGLDVGALERHFATVGSPVMMGGHSDAAAKTILATVVSSGSIPELLVLDPHLLGRKTESSTKISLHSLANDGWLAWRSVQSLTETDFYNICLPLAD